jgi:precorrin-6B methylase 1
VDIFGALNALAPHVAAGGVVVLVTGDPGVCSLARPVIRRFGVSACRVLPGISAVQIAFAAVGVDWFGARMLSAHDTAPTLPPASLTPELRVCLLAGNPANAAWVEDLVRTLTPTHDIHLCENLTLPNESVRQLINPTFPMNPASRSIFIFVRKEATP